MTIDTIAIDSRNVTKGSLFVAIKGVQADGHAFIEKAIEQGAVAILCEIMPTQIKEGIAYIQV
ncbi:Mur ligase domain-containing protein, partial [Staphylococcus aureus]